MPTSPSFEGSQRSWDLKVAAETARMQGIVLTPAHFEILELARSFFSNMGSHHPQGRYQSIFQRKKDLRRVAAYIC